jgi:hypothetical protein
MHPVRMAAACTVLFTLGLLMDGAWAKPITIGGTHSAGEIRQTCESNGGTYYSGGPDNSYGCQTGKGSVTCESSGKCKGNCPSCGAAQRGSGGIKGILQPPKQVGNAPPPSENPPKGKNPVVQGTRPVTVGNQQPTSGGTSTMDRHSGGSGKKQ